MIVDFKHSSTENLHEQGYKKAFSLEALAPIYCCGDAFVCLCFGHMGQPKQDLVVHQQSAENRNTNACSYKFIHNEIKITCIINLYILLIHHMLTVTMSVFTLILDVVDVGGLLACSYTSNYETSGNT
jgi:hypothetical protein